jgi:hypothetical protein
MKATYRDCLVANLFTSEIIPQNLKVSNSLLVAMMKFQTHLYLDKKTIGL